MNDTRRLILEITTGVLALVLVPFATWVFGSIVTLSTSIQVMEAERNARGDRVKLLEAQVSELQDSLQAVELRQIQAFKDLER